MSDRWGAFEENAKLRERVLAVELNIPQLIKEMDRRFSEVRENQAANRAWTERQFAELAALIKGVQVPPKAQDDRLFWAVVVVGVLVAVVGLALVGSWIFASTGGNLA